MHSRTTPSHNTLPPSNHPHSPDVSPQPSSSTPLNDLNDSSSVSSHDNFLDDDDESDNPIHFAHTQEDVVVLLLINLLCSIDAPIYAYPSIMQ